MNAATAPTVAAPGMPYLGIYIAHEHRWIRATAITEVVTQFCCERDEKGWGGSDVGGRLPLYRMNVSGSEKCQIGYVSYNGNVKSNEVLL